MTLFPLVIDTGPCRVQIKPCLWSKQVSLVLRLNFTGRILLYLLVLFTEEGEIGMKFGYFSIHLSFRSLIAPIIVFIGRTWLNRVYLDFEVHGLLILLRRRCQKTILWWSWIFLCCIVLNSSDICRRNRLFITLEQWDILIYFFSLI